MTASASRSLTAGEVAADVGARLADPTQLRAAIVSAGRQTAFPTVGWRPGTLAAGHPGLAVLFGALDAGRPGDGWDRLGHAHLEQAVEVTRDAVPPASLYGGLAGLGFAAATLAGDRDRYQRLLAGIDRALVPRVEATTRRVSAANGCAVSDFDLISGLSGIGAYLLQRLDHPLPGGALRGLLAALAGLLGDSGEPRRWHTPADRTGDTLLEEFPRGNYNCGLAHGVPGPLALLSVAAVEGVEVAGTRTAIDTAARWLSRHRTEDAWGPDWPSAVGLGTGRGAVTAPAKVPPLSRAAWCYGAPGVARALWLAGQALDAAEYRDLAVAGIRAALARPPERRGITSPTFCHGTAGLCMIALRFADDTGYSDLAAGAEALTADLLAAYRPDSLLGYCNVEPGGNLVDQPGLLDGAAGVALTLLATVRPMPAAWDRMFLLG